MYHCTFFNNGIIFFAKIYLDVLFWVGRIVHHAHRRDGLKTEEGKSDAQCAFRRVLCPRALRRRKNPKHIFNQCFGSATFWCGSESVFGNTDPEPGPVPTWHRTNSNFFLLNFFYKRYKTQNDIFFCNFGLNIIHVY